jgi:hypothetical protein
MKLVYASTGLEVKSGDTVHVDGKPFYVMDMREPHKPSSTGRVLCKAMSDKAWINEWYPGVIGAVWIN